ncbi:MAG: DUF481 domain-containing protein [Terriglobales bacterium]
MRSDITLLRKPPRWVCFLLWAVLSSLACAEPPAAVSPAVLLFTNGDRLSGTVVRADNAHVVFKSAIAGEITVPWASVQKLMAGPALVVVTRQYVVRGGSLEGDGKNLTMLRPGFLPTVVPLQKVEMVVSDATYDDVIAAVPGPWQDWKGAATAGVNFVAATQSARGFNGSLALVRALPSLDWLPPVSSTQMHLQGNYGKLSQHGLPVVKTEIYGASMEQDQYLTARRLFAFGDLHLDHNLAQGLSLQQSYGGGVGWKFNQRHNTALELKGNLHFTRQAFFSPVRNNFVAVGFSESLQHLLHGHLQWDESVTISPALTQRRAYQLSGSTGLIIPIARRFSFNTRLADSLIGNPQPGFQRNSLQFTSGLQYTLH